LVLLCRRRFAKQNKIFFVLPMPGSANRFFA
jgi:hypothetical protein